MHHWRLVKHRPGGQIGFLVQQMSRHVRKFWQRFEPRLCRELLALVTVANAYLAPMYQHKGLSLCRWQCVVASCNCVPSFFECAETLHQPFVETVQLS